MSLQAPYATSSSSPQESYGSIAGSTPSWAKTNLHDAGRSHVRRADELGGVGFAGWSVAEAPVVRYGHRVASQSQLGAAHNISEPTVQGAHQSYYTRRPLEGEATGFRRSTREVPQVDRPDRPTGKKFVAEPYGVPTRPHGVQTASDEVRFREAERAPEPGLPRLARPSGITGLRENNDLEISFERSIGRKIRVGQDSYRGLGLAGDTLSPGTGAPYRPEDDVAFFRTLKDSPTFLRFCSTLAPPPKVSAHERRSASLHRIQQAELSAEQQLVASLSLPDGGDD